MSTKFSFFYNNDGDNYIHFYSDVKDDSIVLEKTQKTNVKIELSLEEACAIAKSVNLQELKRQAEITDEQILEFLEKKLKNDYNNIFMSIWMTRVFGDENSTKEEKIQHGLQHYQNIRAEIKKIYDKTISSKSYPIEFGLSEIK